MALVSSTTATTTATATTATATATTATTTTTTTAARKGRRGVGARLNYTQRLEIIEKLEDPDPPTIRSLGRDYGVDEKVIRNIKKNAEEIRRRVLSIDVDTRDQVFRAQIPRFPELEQQLFEWIKHSRRLPIDVSPLMILTKAKQLATTLGISENNFKASWGWYRKFKGRYDLGATLVPEERGAIDCNDSEALKVPDEKIEVTNEETEVTNEKPEVADEKKVVTDAKTEVTDENKAVTDEKTEVTDGKTEEPNEKTEVTDGKTEAPNEKTEVTDEKTEVRDEKTEVKEERTEAPDEKTAVTDEKKKVINERGEKTDEKKEVTENFSSETPQLSTAPELPSSPKRLKFTGDNDGRG